MIAQKVMNHDEATSVFSKHYDRGVSNIDLVGVRLGEVQGNEERFAGEALEVGFSLSIVPCTISELPFNSAIDAPTHSRTVLLNAWCEILGSPPSQSVAESISQASPQSR